MDSAERDHSENEDITIMKSSPMPVKKGDKRDESDLLRVRGPTEIHAKNTHTRTHLHTRAHRHTDTQTHRHTDTQTHRHVRHILCLTCP